MKKVTIQLYSELLEGKYYLHLFDIKRHSKYGMQPACSKNELLFLQSSSNLHYMMNKLRLQSLKLAFASVTSN